MSNMVDVFNTQTPYNTLPDLPPAGDIETRAVLKACIEARAAVAEVILQALSDPLLRASVFDMARTTTAD